MPIGGGVCYIFLANRAMHLGNPHFSLWEIAQEIFVVIVVTFKNLFTLGTCFQVFYSISIL